MILLTGITVAVAGAAGPGAGTVGISRFLAHFQSPESARIAGSLKIDGSASIAVGWL